MKRIAAILGLGCLLSLGCRGQEPKAPEAPAAGAAASGAATTAPAAASASTAEPEAAVRCPDALRVDAGDRRTAEGTLWLAYKAALGPDDEAGFAAFRAVWQPDANTDHIRQQIWPRVREHVGKYVEDPAAPAYIRCRKIDAPGGRVKIFVRSNAAQKTDPPSILVQGPDGWLIDVMTP
jgi:hypothetical protein